MIFFVTLILLVIAVIVCIIADNECWMMLDMFAFVCSIILLIASIIMGVVIICENTCVSGKVASLHQRYEVLQYQIDNDTYDNDNDVGKKELYEKVQNWNEDLAFGREAQNNFWIGIFYPDIYDEFDFIELPSDG